MPALSYTALAQTFPARGLTWSRPGTHIASAYEYPDLTQAGLRGPFFASSADATTIANAPSDDGHVSPKRIGSHRTGEFITSSTVIGSRRWAYSLCPALARALAATTGPMCGGQPVV